MIKNSLTCVLGLAMFATIAVAPGCAQTIVMPDETLDEPLDKTSDELPDKPLLHPLFSENAVLQRDRPITIWGWTTPGKSVVVKLDGVSQKASVATDGRWSAPIAAHAAGGPHALEISSDMRAETRKNLLFGDVWLCSGQSNMGMSLDRIDGAAAKADAINYPNIRLLSVPHEIRETPVSTLNSSWRIASPESVGGFSAVGYFFGRKLNQDLKVPIGLIDSSWGGTSAEAWVSDAGLQKIGDFDEALSQLRDQAFNAPKYRNDAGTKAKWQQSDLNDADWKTMNLPGDWGTQGYDKFDGVVWFRREVTLPASWAGRDLQLNLGAVDDDDTTFWNGAFVGLTEGYEKKRVYTVAGAQIKAGRNVIALRVLDTSGGGGVIGPDLSIRPADASPSEAPISLDGSWKSQRGADLKDMPAPKLRSLRDRKAVPTVLYNGMIAPLLPGQIKGAIWYQGENNAGRAEQYRTLLPALVNDWRAKFEQPLPFYIVQLPNFRAPDKTPRNDDWPRLREAQALAARKLPNSGLAVAIDVGEEKNLHPKNKQDVGLRLALQALKKTYGQPIQADGPTLQSAKANAGKIVLTFDNADGLTLKGEADRVFAIAGKDGKFQWATPVINGNAVMLSSADVPAPVEARFGWSNSPRANLYNSAGLPASPFRTDEG